MRVRDATVATLCAAALATGCGSVNVWPQNATVQRVIDGDTVEVRLEDGGTRTVRVVGMDAPETPHGCYGAEAAEAARRMLADVKSPGDSHRREPRSGFTSGQRVTLREPVDPDDDPYGRLLAHVRLSGGLWAKRMVAGGYARAAVWEPNVGHAEALQDAEDVARRDGRGMWGECR